MKLSNYTTVIDSKDFYLLHNTLHNSVLKVYDNISRSFIDEIRNGEPFKFNDKSELQVALNNVKMIISRNVNESRIVNFHWLQAQKALGEMLQVIILVTRQCNFRCPYCYEEHKNQIMKEETYDNLVKFLITQVKLYGYKSVGLSFFGGEPTLETKNIIKFIRSVKDALPNIDIRSDMTTNGYLLDADTFREYSMNGITRYQITMISISCWRETLQ